MINYQYIRYLFLIPFLTLSVTVSASSIRQLEMSEMLGLAELVFEGEVINSDVRWNDDETLIKTHITFNISDVIVGDYQHDTLEVSFVGGTIGINSMQAEGLRTPEVGEKGIYFIESISRPLVNPLVGWSQGRFLLKKDASGNEHVMTDQHEHVMGITSKTSKARALSKGVARNVVVSKDPSSKGMSAIKFKEELRRRAKK